MHNTPRARSGPRTIVGLLAGLSLVIAVAVPTLAAHEPADGPEVTPSTEEFPGGDPSCTVGVAYRFNSPDDGDEAVIDLGGGSSATVTLLSTGTSLTFAVDGGLAAVVKVKGGVSSPGTDDVNIYDYSGLTGGGIAHDDGLTVPSGQGISHVDFCLVVAPEGAPDTEIEKSASTTQVMKGDAYSYTLTVTNVGDALAEDVHVWDDLDIDLTVVSVTPSQGTCDPVGPSNEVDCALGDLDPGETATVIIEVDTDEADCETVNNRAYVEAEGEGEASKSDRVDVIIDCVESTPTPTPSPTPTGSVSEGTPTPTATPTATPTGSVAEGTPTPDPTATPTGSVLAGNPTPTPGGGTLPDTAMGEFTQTPAAVLSLVLLAALAGMVYLRLARQR